ncbi:MAG: hypothetical protein ACK4EY_16215 [Flavipsychrobacter sp.]
MHTALLLLQSMPPLSGATADATFWGRVGDQAFSIVLLVVFAVFMLRRQKQLEDKMAKYQEDDRTKMMEIIQNNTRVMERIEDHLDKR